MEYVSQITLTIDGQNITDFNSVTEGERELRKPVHLMKKTGFSKTAVREGCQVEYVVPKDAPEVDFASVENGTLTIDKENGVRITYSGVHTLKVGETKYDGEEAATRTIEFGATGRVEE